MVELLLIAGLTGIVGLFSGMFDSDDTPPEEDGPPDTVDRGSPEGVEGLKLRGGPLDDALTGGADNDTLIGNLGNDTLGGAAGADELYGRSGNDLLFGEDGNDTLLGESGDDQLFGGNGDDLLDGGTGNDLLVGGAGDDTMMGGEGADKMRGGSGDDEMQGGDGDDLLFGGAGNDILEGNDGDDFLEGGAGSDIINAGLGNDVIIGLLRSDGQNVLQSSEANTDLNDWLQDVLDPDELYGGTGEDIILMGRGDIAYGGYGADSFLVGPWMAASDDSGVIADFESGLDDIAIILPSSYAGAGEVSIEADGEDALVVVDGELFARVTGAAATLSLDMVSVLTSNDLDFDVPLQIEPVEPLAS